MTLLIARPLRDLASARSSIVPAASPRARDARPLSSPAPKFGRVVHASSATAAKAVPLTVVDGFAAAPPSAKPLGPAVRVAQLPAEIQAMSSEELKGFSGEEVMGMTREQFQKFRDAVLADGGPGVAAMDPQVRKAILRKGFLLEILDLCRAQQERHALCAW